jgi:hypothetical protein
LHHSLSLPSPSAKTSPLVPGPTSRPPPGPTNSVHTPQAVFVFLFAVLFIVCLNNVLLTNTLTIFVTNHDMFIYSCSMSVHDIVAAHNNSDIQTELVYNARLVDIWRTDDALYLGFQELAAEQYCQQCHSKLRHWVYSAFHGLEEHNFGGRRYICLTDLEKGCDEIELEAQGALFEWKAVFGRRFIGMDGVRLLLGENRTPNEREFLDLEFQRCRSPLREMLPRCGILFDEMHTILTDVGVKFRGLFVDREGNVLPGKGLIQLTPDLAAPLGLPVRHDVLIPTNTSPLLAPVHALQDSVSTLYHRLVFAGYDFSDETRWKRCYAHHDCGLPRNDINC